VIAKSPKQTLTIISTNFWLSKLKNLYKLAYLAFLDMKMLFWIFFDPSQPVLTKIYVQKVCERNFPKPAIVIL